MGSRPLETTDDVATDLHSMVIDVRSPAEFALDHLPGAVNLPVLDDDERAYVGTVYKQESTFKARKLGAALVSRNIARILEGPLKDLDPDFHPLIYCWRGGQRSASLALVLAQIGWRTTLLNGGYRTYRRKVVADLNTLPERFRYVCLAGLTGTGKTRLLSRMETLGFQVLDLEGLADHRGSVLGRVPGTDQPSQKQFESRIWQALTTFDTARPIWVESESYKIGERSSPTELWKSLRGATRVQIELPPSARVNLLIEDYAHFLEQPQDLVEFLQPLKDQHGKETLARWTELVETRDWQAFVHELLEVHYDPAYLRSLKRHGTGDTHQVTLASYDDDALDRAIAWCEAEFGK